MEIEKIENFVSVSTNKIEFNLSQVNKEKFESSLIVKNNQNQKIALRILTTKKELYNVVPTYSILQPNTSIVILFFLFKKDKLDDPSKHKFLLEAIFYEETLAIFEKDVKKIFETMTIQKRTVKGTNIRISVVFTESLEISKPKEEPIVKFSEEVSYKEAKNDNRRNKTKSEIKSILPKQILEGNELERLNLEWFKLSNILESLLEENIDLKKKIQIEKSNTFIIERPNLNINTLDLAQPYEFPRYTAYLIFGISFLVGLIFSN